MLRSLLPDTLCQELWYVAMFFGLIGGLIGPSDTGWYSAGVALGAFLAGLWIWVRA